MTSRKKIPKTVKEEKTDGVLNRIMQSEAARDTILLFIIAIALRFYFKEAGLWHTDSVIEALAAQDTLRDGRLRLLMGLGYPAQSIMQTLMYALFHTFFGAQNAEFSTTFTSILFGALTVAIVYLFVRKIGGNRYVGLFSGIILTVLPVFLVLSTYAKNHTTDTFFMMSALYATLIAAEKKTWKYKVLSSVLLGWNMGLRQTSLITLPIMLLLYWRNNPPLELITRKNTLKIRINQKIPGLLADILLFTAPALILFVGLFVPIMIYEPTYSLYNNIMFWMQESGGKGVSVFFPLLNMSIAWATTSLTIFGWILLAGGILVLYLQKDNYLTLAMTLWFVLFFVMLGTSMQVAPRFIIPAMIPAAILMAYSLDYIRANFNEYASYILLLIIVYIMLTNIYSVLEYRKNYCGPCEFSKKLKEIVPANAIILGMDEGPHYQFYGGFNRTLEGTPSNGDDNRILYLMDLYTQNILSGNPLYITTQGLGYDTSAGLKYDDKTMHVYNAVTGREYKNLVYNPSTGALYDTQYGSYLPLTGKYGITLFDTFKVTPVLQMEDEDWHHSDIELAKYTATLFKIELRDNSTLPSNSPAA